MKAFSTLLCVVLILPALRVTGEEGPAYLKSSAFELLANEHLDVSGGDGNPKLRYMFAYEPGSEEELLRTYKPYVHVFAPDGETFLTKAVDGKYTHHRGIFTGWSKLKHGGQVYDLWHMKNGAAQVHQGFVDLETPEGAVGFAARIDWRNPDGEVMLEETREVLLHPESEGAYALVDVTVRLKAVNGEVELNGDPEHAGFQFRPNAQVVDNKSAKYAFDRDDTDAKTDRDYPWVAMTFGLDDGSKYTVQMMRDEGNPDDSRWSCYRDYGRFGNFFVRTIADGESLSYSFRIRISEGEAPGREALQAQFDQWSK
jgi:hypothetical protein